MLLIHLRLPWGSCLSTIRVMSAARIVDFIRCRGQLLLWIVKLGMLCRVLLRVTHDWWRQHSGLLGVLCVYLLHLIIIAQHSRIILKLLIKMLHHRSCLLFVLVVMFMIFCFRLPYCLNVDQSATRRTVSMEFLADCDTLFFARACVVHDHIILLSFSSIVVLLLIFLKSGQFWLWLLEWVKLIDLKAYLANTVHRCADIIILDLLMEQFIRFNLLASASVQLWGGSWTSLQIHGHCLLRMRRVVLGSICNQLLLTMHLILLL